MQTVAEAFDRAWEEASEHDKFFVKLSRLLLVSCRGAKAVNYLKGLLGTDVRMDDPSLIDVPFSYMQVHSSVRCIVTHVLLPVIHAVPTPSMF